MSIAPGSQLGPYEILSPLGAGGMGEVYKARDTRLDRTIAIKVLPEHLSKDPARRERFEREARAVSSLNHPHICTLFDVGEDDGVFFLVMEYIEGETLADRLEKGALPLDQAFEVATQIADALDKAHREGIVHRDLKPGNVMVTKPGVKLLDFGLAKTRQEKLAPTNDSEQPTQHKPLTDAGTILGTVQYMAPEQLEGKEVDARADLFAFGAILYEMLTGHKAFQGESQASLISAIMSAEPPSVSELRPVSPPALDRVVKKCLAKDPDARWQTARDLCDELTWIQTRPETEASAAAPISKRSRSTALVALLVALGVAATIWYVRPRPSPPRVTRFAVSGQPPHSSVGPALAMSPDGKYLASVVLPSTTRQLVLRDMSALEFRELPGTDGAGYRPFFSEDGEWLAFTAGEQLRKIPVFGGKAQNICGVSKTFGGGSWSSDDRILFASRSSLHLVSAGGGNVETLVELDDEAEVLLHPRWLPGNRHALVTVKRGLEETLHSFSLESRELRPLLPNASQAHYVAGGLLFFRRNVGTYVYAAVRFDPDLPSVIGEPIEVSEPIFNPGLLGDSYYAVAESGTLAYLPQRTERDARLLWSDRNGRTTPLLIEPDVFRRPSVSPDGRRLAVDGHRGGADEHDVWLYNLDTGARSRFTVDGHNAAPIWTPDGATITFASRRPTALDAQQIYWQPADESRAATVLFATDVSAYPVSWSPDGKTLAFVHENPQPDIWVLPLDQEPVPLLTSAFLEHSPMFSPDGRWLAYVSDESGREEVYVRGFPGEGPRHPISTGGGREPVWSRDGRQLYFRNPDGTEMWSVATELEPTFKGSKPELVFTRRFYADPNREQTYDISSDGERFLMVEEIGDGRSQEVVIVLNWSEELNRLLPPE